MGQDETWLSLSLRLEIQNKDRRSLCFESLRPLLAAVASHQVVFTHPDGRRRLTRIFHDMDEVVKYGANVDYVLVKYRFNVTAILSLLRHGFIQHTRAYDIDPYEM